MKRYGSPVIIYDTFNRANGALGNAETGQAWQSDGSNTTAWVVSGNVAKRASATTAVTDAAYIDCGKPDVTVSADITMTDYSYSIQIFARMSGTSFNNCMSLILGRDGYLRIRKVIGGTVTNIASYAYSYVSGATHSCKLSCAGNTFKAYLDGELKITVDDDNALKTNTKVGMHLPCGASTAFDWINNFIARG